MNNFDHVGDALIRSVLQGDISEDSLCYALSETMDAALKDMTHPLLTQHYAEKRLSLAQEASDWWNEEGNAFKAVECLQEFWTI